MVADPRVSEAMHSFTSGKISRRAFITRLTLLGVSTAGIGAILAACGASATSAPGASGGATGAGPWAADPKSLSGTVKLYKGPFIKNEADFMAKFVDRFHAKVNPNINVEVTQYDWTSAEALMTASLSNGDHDIVYIPEVFYGKFPTKDGPLEDMEPWIKDPEWQTITKDFFKAPNYPERPKPPGGILGAVIWTDGPQSNMFINLDLFDKAGVDPAEMVKSYDNMTEAARKIRALGPDTWGIMMRENGAKNFGWFEWYGYMMRAGTNFLNADNTAPAINTPEFAAALQMIQDWHVKDKVMPPFGQYDWPGIRAQFIAGKVGILQEEPLFSGVINSNNPPVTFKWDFSKYPPGPKADVLFANAAQYVMSNKSQNKQAAWEVIKSWSIPLADYADAIGGLVLYDNWDKPSTETGRDKDPFFEDKPKGWFSDPTSTNDTVRVAEMGLLPLCKGPLLHRQLQQFKTLCEPYFDDVYAGKLAPQDALDKATADIKRALETG